MRRVVLLLLVVYGLLLWRVRWDFELTGDDGSWIRLARELVENRYVPLWGVMSSQGIPNPAYAVWVYALFFWLLPGFLGVILGVGLSVLVTHAVLLRVGSRGWMASLLLFFSPAFFVFYNQKLWQVSFLPLVLAILFFCAQEFLAGGGAGWLLGAYACVGVGTGFHFSAVLLLPALFLLASLGRASFGAVLGGGVILVVAFLPSLLWFAQQRPFLVFPLVALCFGGLLTFRMSERATRDFFPVVALALPFIALASSRGAFLTGIWGFLDVLPARSLYLAAHVGTGSWDSLLGATWWRAFSVAALLVAFYFVDCLRRWRSLAPFEQFLFFSLWIPVWLLVGSAAVFSDFPHQWYVFLFPGAALAQVAALSRLGRAGWAVFAGLVLLSAWSDIHLMRFVEKSGGASWHLASVSSKLAVLRDVYAAAPGARIYAAVEPGRAWWDYDVEGWREAAAQNRPAPLLGPHRWPAVWVYLYEPGAFFADPRIASRLESAGARMRELRGVRIYELPHAMGGLDVRL